MLGGVKNIDKESENAGKIISSGIYKGITRKDALKDILKTAVEEDRSAEEIMRQYGYLPKMFDNIDLSSGKATKSLKDFFDKSKNGTSIIGNLATSLGMSSGALLGWGAAIAAVAIGAAVTWDKLTTTVKETEEAISSINSKKASIESEIAELENIGYRNSQQNERLELLKKELSIQERLLEIEERRRAREKTDNEFADWFDSDNYATQLAKEQGKQEDVNSILAIISGITGGANPLGMPIAAGIGLYNKYFSKTTDDAIKEAEKAVEKYKKITAELDDNNLSSEDRTKKLKQQDEAKEDALKATAELEEKALQYQATIADIQSMIDNGQINEGKGQELIAGYNKLLEDSNKKLVEFSKILDTYDYSGEISKILSAQKFDGVKDKLVELGKADKLSADNIAQYIGEDLEKALTAAGLKAEDLYYWIMNIVDPDMASKTKNKNTLLDAIGKGKLGYTPGTRYFVDNLSDEELQAAMEIVADVNIDTSDWDIEYWKKKIQEKLNTEPVVEAEVSLGQGLVKSNEELSKFKSNIESAYQAYGNLMNSSLDSSSFLDSVLAMSKALSDMGASDEIMANIKSFDDLKDSVDKVAESYAEAVAKQTGITDPEFLNLIKNSIIATSKYKAELTDFQTELGSLKSAYSSITEIAKQYNETGYITFDQLDSLLQMSPQYLACLVDENGQLQMNQQAMLDLANLRLDEAEATAVEQAITALNALTHEDEQNALSNSGIAYGLGIQHINEYNAALGEEIQKLGITIKYVNELNSAISGAKFRGASDSQVNQVLDNLATELSLIDSARGNLGSHLGDMLGGSGSTSSSSKETFDWIETAISRIQRTITNLGKTVSATYKSWSDRNKALKQEVGEINNEIALQQAAYNTYMAKANSVKLDKKYKDLVMNGGLRIDEISDEGTKQAINDFKQWYEKALAASDAVEDLQGNLAELANQKFDLIKSEFQGLIDEVEFFNSMTDKAISAVEARGKIAGKSFYEAKMSNNQDKLGFYTQMRDRMIAELSSATPGTQQWNDLRKQIFETEESIADCKLEAIELEEKLKEVAMLNFDNLAEQFSNAISLLSSQRDITDSIISMVETSGRIASESYYENLVKMSKAQVSELRQEYERLSQELANAMASGDIQMYDENWYKMKSKIEDVKKETLAAAEATIKYARALEKVKWDMFDRGISGMQDLIDESNFMIDLIGEDNLFKDGEWTDDGLAVQGLHVQNYETYVNKLKELDEEAEKIKAQLEKDPTRTDLIDRYKQLKKEQQEAIKGMMEEKKALRDLAEKGYNSLLDTLRKLIEQYKKSLQSAKDLYDYQNKISEKTKNIGNLQKQLLAFSNGGDSTEENRAKVQKLNSDLEAAKRDLEETEYDKWLSDQNELLDGFLQDLENWIEEKLSELEDILQQAIEATNLNGESINNTLHEHAAEVGYTFTDEFESIWGRFEEGNSFTNDILQFTSDTTAAISDYMNNLATEAGLEEFFSGEDLNFLNSMASIDSNISATNEAIERSAEAISQITSNVVNDLDNDMMNAARDIVGAINNAGSQVASSVGSAYNAMQSELSNGRNSGNDGSGNLGNGGNIGGLGIDPVSGQKKMYVIVDENGKIYGGKYQSQNQAQKALESMAADYARKKGSWTAYDQFLKKYHITTQYYKKGGVIGDGDNFLDIIAKALGEDHMVAAKEGERILTPKQNEAFEKMVNANFGENNTIYDTLKNVKFTPLNEDEQLKYSMLDNVVEINENIKYMCDELWESSNKIKPLSNNVSNRNAELTSYDIGDINISLPNVTNHEDFINWAKTDGTFEKIVQSMSIGRMMGGNKYNKLKY